MNDDDNVSGSSWHHANLVKADSCLGTLLQDRTSANVVQANERRLHFLKQPVPGKQNKQMGTSCQLSQSYQRTPQYNSRFCLRCFLLALSKVQQSHYLQALHDHWVMCRHDIHARPVSEVVMRLCSGGVVLSLQGNFHLHYHQIEENHHEVMNHLMHRLKALIATFMLKRF